MESLAQQLGNARAALADAIRAQAQVRSEIESLNAQIANVRERLRRGGGNIFTRLRLQAQLGGLQVQLNVLRGRLQATDQQIVALNRRTELLVAEQKLHDSLGEMPDATLPVVLLPVRIETRFVSTGETHELWVRVYPDDLHLDSHEPELTEDEEVWGKHFWEQIWHTGRGTDEAAENERRQVWAQLAGRFGPERAAWIADVLRPRNPQARPPTPLAPRESLPEPIDFVSPSRRAEAWTRAPIARGLPDRWIITGYRGEVRVLLHAGEPVSKNLPAGLDPSAEPIDTQDDTLALDQGARWLVDFAEAQRVGMGMRIALTADDAQDGFDTLFVFGMRAAANTRSDGSELERLLDAHHFTEGLGFVPKGTPTNNAAAVKSGFSTRDPGFETSYSVEQTQSDGTDESNGALTARALGVAAERLRHIHHAPDSEESAARAMNSALWAATGGYFLEQFFADTLAQDVVDEARRHFVTAVRAGGPFPTLRVGNQPYGLLPVTVLDQWRGSNEGNGENSFLDLLKKMRVMWRAAATRTPHVREEADLDQAQETLLEILSASPASLAYDARPVFDHEFFGAASVAGTQSGRAQLRQREAAVRAVFRDLGIDRDPRVLRTILSSRTFEINPDLVEPDTAADESQPKELSAAQYIDWLLDSSFETIRDETEFPAAANAPTSLLYLLLRHALLLAYATVAYRIQLGAGEATPDDRQEPALVDIRATGTRTVGRHVDHGLPGLGAVPLHKLTGADHPDAALLDDVRASLNRLRDTPADTLKILLVETLDLFSHRLDAWITSLATKRLLAMREKRPAGVVLGGFGWVENLRPAAPTAPVTELPDNEAAPLVRAAGNAGFVHTPSLNHAATAAVMRSGYLAATGEAQSHPFAIDLSSRRVRLAQWLLEGVREGQSLRALLGYRFERNLHEHSLDRYILPFRKIAPFGALNKVAADLEAAEHEVARLRGEPHPDLVGARVRAANARTVIQRLSSERGSLTNQRTTAQRDAQRFRGQLDATQKEIRRVENVMFRLQSMRPPRSTVHLLPRLRELETERRNQQNSISSAQRRINKANGRLQRIPGELTTATTRLRNAEREIRALEGRPHPGLAQAVAAAQVLRQRREALLEEHRKRFLFPDSASLEAMETLAATNVIDGLALLELFREDAIPFGGRGLPGASGGDHAALVAQLESLADTVDAVGDLLTAESIHQMVVGNPLRTGESLDAVARGEMPPPEFDVVRTPRTGTAVTHRIVVLFGPEPPDSPWPHEARHAMAAAEPRLDRWAGHLLGEPERIRCKAAYLASGTGAVLHQRDVRLSELDLSALDVIYLANGGEDSMLAVFEARVHEHLVHTRPSAVPADATLALDFDRQPDFSPDDTGLVEFVALASVVSRCLLEARALESGDLAHEESTLPANVDLNELRERADDAVASFEEAHAKLRDLVLAERNISGSVAANDWRAALLQISYFGMSEAAPAVFANVNSENPAAQAPDVLQQVESRLDRLRAVIRDFDRDAATDDALRQHDLARFACVFGPKFRVLPSFTPVDSEVLVRTLENSDELQAGDPLAAVTWFQRVARVRDGVRRFNRAMLFSEALSGRSLLKFRVGQLPHNDGERWVALPPRNNEEMLAGRLSLVTHMPKTFAPNGSVTGLVIDEWTEVVPNRQETTGIAFHFDQPGTQPPQSLLLAIPPDDREKWDIGLLEAIIRETLELAKLRTVDARLLAQETDLDQVLPALYFGLNLAADTVSTDFTRATSGAGNN